MNLDYRILGNTDLIPSLAILLLPLLVIGLYLK